MDNLIIRDQYSLSNSSSSTFSAIKNVVFAPNGYFLVSAFFALKFVVVQLDQEPAQVSNGIRCWIVEPHGFSIPLQRIAFLF
jgi:hypothetical protein